MGTAGLYVQGFVPEGAGAGSIPPQLVAFAFQTLEYLVNTLNTPGYVGHSWAMLSQLASYPRILRGRLEEVHDGGTYMVQNEFPVWVLTPLCWPEAEVVLQIVRHLLNTLNDIGYVVHFGKHGSLPTEMPCLIIRASPKLSGG